MNQRATFWEQVFKLSSDIVSREIAGEMLMVPVSGDLADLQQVFAANQVAQAILKQINGTADLSAIRDQIITLYDVDLPVLENDLREFIEMLQVNKLVFPA